MKLEVPDEYVPLIVHALEHYYAYTQAAKREDSRYPELIQWFNAVEKKTPASETGESSGRKRGRKKSA